VCQLVSCPDSISNWSASCKELGPKLACLWLETLRLFPETPRVSAIGGVVGGLFLAVMVKSDSGASSGKIDDFTWEERVNDTQWG
jgi:hypothetical protein